MGQGKKGGMRMDKPVLRAFGYFMAANFQAVILIGVAFKLVSYLEEHYPVAQLRWAYLVWPACVLIIGHSYFLIMRQILKAEEKRKK